jgi:hypothetical protein
MHKPQKFVYDHLTHFDWNRIRIKIDSNAHIKLAFADLVLQASSVYMLERLAFCERAPQ